MKGHDHLTWRPGMKQLEVVMMAVDQWLENDELLADPVIRSRTASEKAMRQINLMRQENAQLRRLLRDCHNKHLDDNPGEHLLETCETCQLLLRPER